MEKVIFILLISIVFFACSNQEKEKKQKNSDEAEISTLKEKNSTDQEIDDEEKDFGETKIEFANLEHDFGEVTIDEKSYTTFIYTNTGSNPLIIQDVETSCGCTVPEWDEKPLAPGQTAEIEVAIKPTKVGAFKKTAMVYVNTEEKVITLTIKGRGI
jgi:uncharacterized membrane protein